MTNLKRILIAASVGVSGILLVSGVLFSYRAEAACVNPSPLPPGYAAPCPVFSLSATNVPQSGTLTLTATPQSRHRLHLHHRLYLPKQQLDSLHPGG